MSSKKLQNKNFIPYFQLHEFEALLFSNPKIMEEYFSLDQNVPENSFLNIRNEFETPEHINNSRFTAPSKRIKGIIQSYDKKKTLDGASIAEKIGLPTIRSHCPHFNDWILQLENLTEL